MTATKNRVKATKFVVRFEDESDAMHQAAKAAAKAEHMSLNSFVLRAIDRDLNRGATMDRLLDQMEKQTPAVVNNLITT